MFLTGRHLTAEPSARSGRMSVDAEDPPYSKEFRREAVQLLRTSGRSVPQLAKELCVSEGSLRNWAGQLDVDEGWTPLRSSWRFSSSRWTDFALAKVPAGPDEAGGPPLRSSTQAGTTSGVSA
jgi:Transposase